MVGLGYEICFSFLCRLDVRSHGELLLWALLLVFLKKWVSNSATRFAFCFYFTPLWLFCWSVYFQAIWVVINEYSDCQLRKHWILKPMAIPYLYLIIRSTTWRIWLIGLKIPRMFDSGIQWMLGQLLSCRISLVYCVNRIPVSFSFLVADTIVVIMTSTFRLVTQFVLKIALQKRHFWSIWLMVCYCGSSSGNLISQVTGKLRFEASLCRPFCFFRRTEKLCLFMHIEMSCFKLLIIIRSLTLPALNLTFFSLQFPSFIFVDTFAELLWPLPKTSQVYL